MEGVSIIFSTLLMILQAINQEDEFH